MRASDGPKVRFDGLEDTESERFNVRRLRGRNLFQSEAGEVASVVSDNTHLYRRSRSAHTLDNKSTKKYLLKSKGKTLDDVSSKMKLIENSFGVDVGNKAESKDINEVIYELEGEIKSKEKQISELYKQFNNQNCNRDDNSKIELKLGLLETQMNAKILQMQSKKAKLFKLKKSQDSSVCNKSSSSLTSLYDLVSQADESLLFSSSVTYDNISKAQIGKNGLGLILTDDISFDLKTGDRFFTMNDVNILNITQEEWSQFKVSTAFPVDAVVLRSRSRLPTAGGGFSSPDISGIKEDIAIIQSTLEQKLNEGRSISSELDKAKKEKKNLQQENLRLNHRIAYLEDQTTELQEGLKQVRDSLSRTLSTTDIIQVITKLDSDSSGVGSSGDSQTSDSPDNVRKHSGDRGEKEFISRLLIGSESSIKKRK